MASRNFDRLFSQTVAETSRRIDVESKPPEESKTSTPEGVAAGAVKEILEAWKGKDYFRCGSPQRTDRPIRDLVLIAGRPEPGMKRRKRYPALLARSMLGSMPRWRPHAHLGPRTRGSRGLASHGADRRAPPPA